MTWNQYTCNWHMHFILIFFRDFFIIILDSYLSFHLKIDILFKLIYILKNELLK